MLPYHPDNEPLLKALVAVIGIVFFIGLLTTVAVFGLGIWKLAELLH